MIEVWRYDRDNQSSLIEEGRQYIDNKKTKYWGEKNQT